MKNRRYDYIRGKQDLEDELQTMRSYADHQLEIEKAFIKYIYPYIHNKDLNIFEGCCGIGYLANHLSELSPKSKFYCIDQCNKMIEEANRRFYSDNLKFRCIDIYDIKNAEKTFDISYVFNTLMVIPHYDEILKKLMSLTKDYIFFSSLFYDGWIDYDIKIREWKMNAGKRDYNKYYNVYSLQKFREFAIENGAKDVEWAPFNINIDLKRENKDRMGTYTLSLKDDKKVEITGILLKEWYFIKVSL